MYLEKSIYKNQRHSIQRESKPNKIHPLAVPVTDMAFGFQNEYNLTVKFCDIILLFTSKKEE
jgi:hypothetical protein